MAPRRQVQAITPPPAGVHTGAQVLAFGGTNPTDRPKAMCGQANSAWLKRSQAAHERRGSADCCQPGEAARAITQSVTRDRNDVALGMLLDGPRRREA